MFAWKREVQPPISSTGARASEALAMPVTQFVTPGPAVTIATPSVSRQLCVGMRHVHRRAFVAHVDDADSPPREVIPDRLDVPALEAEDPVDPACLEHMSDPGGHAVLVPVQVLSVGHRLLPCDLSASGQHLAQDAVQDLPRGRARHLVGREEHHPARPLETCEPVL
jgi:hypothetical protein